MSSILIVEDEPAMAQALTERLESENYQVHVEEDAEGALDELRERRFDLALLDLRLPGMTGLEMMDTMRNDAAIDDENMKIIVLTNVMDSVVEKYVSARKLNYLVKADNSLDDIVVAVGALLEISAKPLAGSL